MLGMTMAGTAVRTAPVTSPAPHGRFCTSRQIISSVSWARCTPTAFEISFLVNPMANPSRTLWLLDVFSMTTHGTSSSRSPAFAIAPVTLPREPPEVSWLLIPTPFFQKTDPVLVSTILNLPRTLRTLTSPVVVSSKFMRVP